MSDEIARPGDIPLSTHELIAALKRGGVLSTGAISLEILDAMEIQLATSAQFAIAVLIRALRERDVRVAELEEQANGLHELFKINQRDIRGIVERALNREMVSDARTAVQRLADRYAEAEKTITHLRTAKNCYYDCVDKREANQRIAEAQEKAMEIVRPMVAEGEARADAAEKRAAVLTGANDGWKRREDLIAAENRRLRELLSQCERLLLDHGDPFRGDDWQTMQDIRAAIGEGNDSAREGGGE